MGALAVVTACMVAGCARQVKMIDVKPEVAMATKRYRKEYIMAPGDEIDVVVLKHAEVSRPCVIRSDGYISLPMLDDVKAAGLSPTQLDERLTELFSARLTDPEVTVIATQVRPPMVFVAGEVGATTVVLLRDAPTAAEAVLRAGGFTNWAKAKSVLIIRLRDDNRLIAMHVDMRGLRGQEAPYMALRCMPLQADDIVFVPKTRIYQVSLFVEQHINTILTGVNSVLNTWNQVQFTELVDAQLGIIN